MANKYTWTGLGQKEDAIAAARLVTEINQAFPGLETLSMSAKRDAVLAECLSQDAPYPPQFSDADLVARGIATHGWVHAALGASPGNTALAINTLFLAPFPIRRTGTINRLSCRLATNGGAGAVLRFGLYDSDVNSQLASNRLADSGEFVADSGAPVNFTAAVSVAVRRGQLIWLAYLAGVGAPAPTVSVVNAVPFAENDSGTSLTGFAVTQAYGALPAVVPSTGWSTSQPANVKLGFA
jgi:hypothetical protein